MNKRYLQVILVIAIGFIFQTSISFGQDSARIKSSEEFTALKKGNFAIYLEFGSILFRTGSTGYSYPEYDWLLTAKYQLSEKTALRISGGSLISGESGIVNKYDNGTYDSLKPWGNNSSFNTTVNIQHFLSTKSKVKPFFSLGLYAKYYYNGSTDIGYWSKTEEWGIGPFASFGAEMFVLDNISIIGEYIMKGTIGKKYSKYMYYNENYITSERYEYTKEYNLDFNTFKVGLSVYF